jgi:hypothetical protein
VQALETRTAAPPQRLSSWWHWFTQRPLWRRLARA